MGKWPSEVEATRMSVGRAAPEMQTHHIVHVHAPFFVLCTVALGSAAGLLHRAKMMPQAKVTYISFYRQF